MVVVLFAACRLVEQRPGQARTGDRQDHEWSSTEADHVARSQGGGWDREASSGAAAPDAQGPAESGSVTSATVAPSAVDERGRVDRQRDARARRRRATPGPTASASATTGQAWVLPSGVIVPRT